MDFKEQKSCVLAPEKKEMRKGKKVEGEGRRNDPVWS